MSGTDEATADAAAGGRLKGARRWILWAAYVAFLAVLAEGTARAFWAVRYDLPLIGSSDHRIHSFYPSLAAIESSRRVPQGHDVLLLGGSVLDREFGSVSERLEERLRYELGGHVRVHNLGTPAHTSRDSWLKYQHLEGVDFDAVVLYHGINEARANNVPDSLFSVEYSHFAWYRLVNSFVEDDPLRPVALGFTVQHVARRLRERLGEPTMLDRHNPNPEWLEHGADTKSAVSFAQNYRSIVAAAERRGQPILIGTFANYVPDGYTLARFGERDLDYNSHLMSVESWGDVSAVVRTLDRHNAVVREIAAESEHAVLIDVEAAIPDGARYFNDICHLTHEGSSAWVDAVAPRLLEILGSAEGSASGSG